MGLRGFGIYSGIGSLYGFGYLCGFEDIVGVRDIWAFDDAVVSQFAKSGGSSVVCFVIVLGMFNCILSFC